MTIEGVSASAGAIGRPAIIGPQHGEKRRRHVRAVDDLRSVPHRELERLRRIEGQVIERVERLMPALGGIQLEQGANRPWRPLVIARGVDDHEAIGIAVRERSNEQPVDDAEDRRVRADRQREGGDRHDGEPRRPVHPAECVPHVPANHLQQRKPAQVARAERSSSSWIQQQCFVTWRCTTCSMPTASKSCRQVSPRASR
jgi:hypothetical protein